MSPAVIRRATGFASSEIAWSLTLALILALFFAACGDESATPVTGGIEHAADQSTPILVLRQGGGLPPPPPRYELERHGWRDDLILALYGDGRLLIGAPAERQQLQLSEAGIQRLLAMAVHDGHLFEQPDRYESAGCGDCGGVWLQLAAGGRSKSVFIYAYGLATPTGEFDRSLYDAADRLVKALRGITSQTFPPEEVISAASYDPPGAFVAAVEWESEDARGWPAGLPGLAIGGQAVCGRAADQLIDFVPPGEIRSVRVGAIGYAVGVRPLLPDDPGALQCAW